MSAEPQPFKLGSQLVLPMRLSQDIGFENFYGSTNERAAALLKQELNQGNSTLIYLAGGRDSGKTHLASASMALQEAAGQRCCYWSMAEHAVDGEDMLTLFRSFEDYAFVVIEALDQWLIDAHRETALFNLYNVFLHNGKRLMLTANQTPACLNLTLPDLSSRLSSGLTVRLEALNDADKQVVLAQVAKSKGLTLEDEVAAYIIRRSPRNMGELLDVLARLDAASMIEKRKLTVPFVKHVLAW